MHPSRKCRHDHLLTVTALFHLRSQLDLSNNKLTGPNQGPFPHHNMAGILAISEALKVTPSVTKILVGGNRLRDEGTIILCDALRESTVSKVEELSLHNNGIGPDGAKAIAALCIVCASLTQVKLDGFALPIKQLKGTEPVASLDFRFRGLGVASAVVIASLIQGNASLTSLDLSLNWVGPELGVVMAEALKANASLTLLDVSSNYLGEEGEAVLRNAVEGRSGFELLL